MFLHVVSATESDSGAGEEDKSGGGGGEMDKTAGPRKCVARNITCVEFPTTAQCKGIAVGGCFSESRFNGLTIPRQFISEKKINF